MAGPYLKRLGSAAREVEEVDSTPSRKCFPDIPRDELDVDALDQVGDEVSVTVDEWRVVDGADVLFVKGGARLVDDALAGGLPAPVPPTGYDVPGVADVHLPGAALGDVVELLGGGEVRGRVVWGGGRGHEGDGVEGVLALVGHVCVDVVGGTEGRRGRALRCRSLCRGCV